MNYKRKPTTQQKISNAFSFLQSPKVVSLLSLLVIIIILPVTFLLVSQQTHYEQHAATNSLISPSGEAVPIGDIPGWHQIFTDDFTTDVPVGSFPGSVYASKWDVYPDGWKDDGHGTYYPSKVVSVSKGILNMHLHTENGIHMIAAPVPKLPTYGQLYGRYTIRFKCDPVSGYKTAWLLWPNSEVWPRDGEMDFPEGNLTGTMNAFMHRQNGTSGNDTDGFSTNITYTSWHTTTIEWLPNHLSFILDGQTIGTSTNRVPNTPMHYVIQTQTADDGSVPSDTATGNCQVDWVAIYAPSSATPTQTITTSPTSFEV